jgi:hypothetical protein
LNPVASYQGSSMKPMVCAAALVPVVSLCGSASAQEKSVRPGVNDPFKNAYTRPPQIAGAKAWGPLGRRVGKALLKIRFYQGIQPLVRAACPTDIVQTATKGDETSGIRDARLRPISLPD